MSTPATVHEESLTRRNREKTAIELLNARQVIHCFNEALAIAYQCSLSCGSRRQGNAIASNWSMERSF
jgi:hypothetical protein